MHVLWKRETFIEEDTRYKQHYTQDNDPSVHFKVGTLGPHTILPIIINYPNIFSWISSKVWNLFPFKGDFSFRKSQKSQGTKSGLQWGWVTWVIQCFTKKLCMRRDALVGVLSWEAANHCGPLKEAATCPQLRPSESSKWFLWRNVQA